MNLIASSPTSFWNVWEGYQPQQTSYWLQAIFAMWPTSCNITKCFGREIRMKSLAWWRNWAKTISKKWPRPLLNKTNKFKFNKRAMNKYEPGDSIRNLLSLSWGLFTFKPQRSASTKVTYTMVKPVDGDRDRHSEVRWITIRWEWRSTHGTHTSPHGTPFSSCEIISPGK